MSQQSEIVLKLREMILCGELLPGSRVVELGVADAMGVSRTPVRFALGVLAREGLVEPMPNQRGYMVRSFTDRDIYDATELRGVLEGMAARLVAERGLKAESRDILEDCVAQGAAIFQRGSLGPEDGSRWAELNGRFHRTIVEAAGNMPLAQAVRINSQVPFAGAGAFLGNPADQVATRRQFAILREAQHQHEIILDCLLQGAGSRVEAMMREHSFVAIENISLFRSAQRLPVPMSRVKA
jgi:GntR family transcriptional regulator of vanillate catabolism